MTFQHTWVAALLAVSSTAWAQGVSVADPWVRATVPQQQATGAFMRLTAERDVRLVSVSSPVAGVVEIHEMAMDGDVMKMRALPGGLPLKAGTPVELKPGGYHVMLLDLKQAVKAGDQVPLTLTLQGADGQTSTQQLNAPVRALGAGQPAAAGGHGAHKH